MRRLTTILLIATIASLYCQPLAAKRDSTLWAGIKEMGVTYQQGQCDSALTLARHLLPVAESQNDDLAQASLYNFIGICETDQGHQALARQAFTQSVTIAEAGGFLQKAIKSNNKFLFQTMLPAYAQLAINCHDAKLKDESLRYAKTGMEWIANCEYPELRTSTTSTFAEILMAHKEYALIYEPMKQASLDAAKLNQPDFALMMATYLIQIEYQVLHREPADIPWIKIGEQLMEFAKTDKAKSSFLSVTKLTIGNNGKEEEQAKATPDNEPDSTLTNTPAVTAATIPDTIPNNQYQETKSPAPASSTKEQGPGLLIIIVGTILALVLIVFIVYVLWQRRLRKKASEEKERQMNERYRQGQEQERSRLAKELHDGVSNQLLAIEMRLHEDGLTPQTMQLISESREQVRRVSHELIPPEFEYATLDEVVRDYATGLDGIHQCQVSYESTPADADWSLIPKTQALEVYRIIQEAVGNALKHAEPSLISIGMHLHDARELTVIISDNGNTRQTESKEQTGIGSRTISQRATAIGGEVETVHHAYGTTVQLSLKISDTAK